MGEYVDLDDLPLPDFECGGHRQPPRETMTIPTPPLTSASVACADRKRCAPASAPLATACAPRTSLDAPTRGGAVGSEHDVRVEHGEKRVEVAAARGGEEGFDDLPLAGEVGAGSLSRSLHPAAGAAGELPGCGRRATHDGGDLVEGDGEHVVQHEGEPLGGSQRFEHDEQRETDRVGQQRFLLRIAPSERLAIGS